MIATLSSPTVDKRTGSSPFDKEVVLVIVLVLTIFVLMMRIVGALSSQPTRIESEVKNVRRDK
jgi:hypothetical protein